MHGPQGVSADAARSKLDKIAEEPEAPPQTLELRLSFSLSVHRLWMITVRAIQIPDDSQTISTFITWRVVEKLR